MKKDLLLMILSKRLSTQHGLRTRVTIVSRRYKPTKKKSKSATRG